MYEVIGKCSICGGQVEAFVGPWYGTHPPLARCRSCGAVEATSENVIPMVPYKTRPLNCDELNEYKKELGTLSNLKSFKDMMKELSDSFKWI